MTQSTPTAHARWLGSIAAVALAFAGAGIALASDAHDPEADARETVIVKVVKHDGHAKMGHDDNEGEVAERCGGMKPQVDTSEDTKGDDGKVRHARIVICNHSGRTDVEMLSALEKARARLAAVTELSDDAKSKALASIDREIDRLKAQPSYSKQ